MLLNYRIGYALVDCLVAGVFIHSGFRFFNGDYIGYALVDCLVTDVFIHSGLSC